MEGPGRRTNGKGQVEGPGGRTNGKGQVEGPIEGPIERAKWKDQLEGPSAEQFLLGLHDDTDSSRSRALTIDPCIVLAAAEPDSNYDGLQRVKQLSNISAFVNVVRCVCISVQSVCIYVCIYIVYA